MRGPLSDSESGNASHDYPWRNISRYNRPSGHNCAFTNCHSGNDNRAGGNPYAVPDCEGLGIHHESLNPGEVGKDLVLPRRDGAGELDEFGYVGVRAVLVESGEPGGTPGRGHGRA